MRRRIADMALRRAAVGASAVLLPGPTARLLGYPAEQNSPAARLMGRLFGVRNIALGALVWRARDELHLSRWAYKLNVCVGIGDAAALGLAILGRGGIGRAALSTLGLVIVDASGFLALLRARRPVAQRAIPRTRRIVWGTSRI